MIGVKLLVEPTTATVAVTEAVVAMTAEAGAEMATTAVVAIVAAENSGSGGGRQQQTNKWQL